MLIYRCTHLFFTDGESPVEGALYVEDHPLVRKYPSAFVPAEVFTRGGVEEVEEATAAPGERRKVGRP